MILLGNTFPTTLIRRKVTIEPISEETAKSILADGFESFWGHNNTIKVANKQLDIDVTPKTERPVIELSDINFPMLNGKTFDKVLILSPCYLGKFRPQIGEEVGEDKIVGWQCMFIRFE